MSSYTVIAETSEVLRHVLWEAFDGDPVVRSIVGSEAAIVFTNPTETARDSANRLSLWLYQITENEFVKNQPVGRRNGHTTQPETPFALNLNYLITPFAPSGEADHLLLGLTLQTLYENAILVLQHPGANIFEELRLIFCRLNIEELTRIWEALREPYRLSVCYQVRVAHIDSLRQLERARVMESTSEYHEYPERVEAW
jgi:hypothetical protein